MKTEMLKRHSGVKLGMTLITMKPRMAALFEPKASASQGRVEVLKKAGEIGIRTFFPGPLLSCISDRGEGSVGLSDTVMEVNPDYLLVGHLNPRYGVWTAVSATLSIIPS